MSPVILTASSKQFDLLQPDPDLIDIEDIAHALSHLCRFTGHTREFYSVAEHSVRVSLWVPPELALEALLHDATEAYIGDVSSPLKAQLHAYRNIEFALDQAIRKRFGLPPKQSPAVKHADLVMLATERRDLMPSTPEPWPILEGIACDPTRIRYPATPNHAKSMFLKCFAEYAEYQTITQGAFA